MQFKKTNRNEHAIRDLTERSFAMRRREIIEKNMYLDQIFDKFPFLQETDMVSTYFSKMLNWGGGLLCSLTGFKELGLFFPLLNPLSTKVAYEPCG